MRLLTSVLISINSNMVVVSESFKRIYSVDNYDGDEVEFVFKRLRSSFELGVFIEVNDFFIEG